MGELAGGPSQARPSAPSGCRPSTVMALTRYSLHPPRGWPGGAGGGDGTGTGLGADLVSALLFLPPLLKLGSQGPATRRAALLQLLPQLLQLGPLPAVRVGVSRAGSQTAGRGRRQALPGAPGCLLAQPLLLLGHLAVEPPPLLLQGPLLLLQVLLEAAGRQASSGERLGQGRLLMSQWRQVS